MSEILLFHHVQGLTPGIAGFAESLRSSGHIVHTPDLLDGRTFDSIDEGLAYVKGIGAETVLTRGVQAAAGLPAELVYVGFSLGVMPAQQLAQTRPGARGAVLVHACLPAEEFGGWPAGVPVQVHAMEADAFFVDDGDLDAARALVSSTPGAELFLYPGDAHLFADSSLPSYDPAASSLLVERVLRLLEVP